jgi:predicted nucleic acid-binding Zn ribbon protein
MLTHIQRSTQTVTRGLGLSESLALVDRAWESEIGGLASMARVVAIDRDALVVEVDSAPAMQELTLRKKELVRRINRHFPDPFIKWLTLRIV